MHPKVYISYSWQPDSLQIADTIDQDWQDLGIQLIRDKRDIHFKQSIRAFMQSMSSGDYVLVIVNKDYLQSKNCMFEALELFQDPAFKDKILPIITRDTNISSAIGRIGYINHWETQIANLNQQIKGLSGLANLEKIMEEVDHLSRIRSSIDQFSGVLSDMRSSYWPDIKDNGYKEILDYIGFTGSKV